MEGGIPLQLGSGTVKCIIIWPPVYAWQERGPKLPICQWFYKDTVTYE